MDKTLRRYYNLPIGEVIRHLFSNDPSSRPEQIPRRRELNAEFHLSICRASGRRYLVRLIESLWKWFPSAMLYEGMLRQIESIHYRAEASSHSSRAGRRFLGHFLRCSCGYCVIFLPGQLLQLIYFRTFQTGFS